MTIRNHKRTIGNSNIKLFTNAIKNISWENILVNANPTESFDKFSKRYTTTYETLSIETKTNQEMDDKWYCKFMKKKDKLYKTYLNNPCGRTGNIYKRYKNKINHVIKVAKKMYYVEQLIKYKHDTKMI